MNLKCAIVDDEPLALGLLESYVNKTPFLELVGKSSSAVQAIKELPEKHIDLLFLDIQMPELNGLEFSKMVDSGTRIVFTTAFDQYAIDGYKVNDGSAYPRKRHGTPGIHRAAQKHDLSAGQPAQ